MTRAALERLSSIRSATGRWNLASLLLVIACCLYPAPVAAAPPYPATAIVDEAVVLSPDENARLSRRLHDHQRAHRVQVAVILTRTTGGESIEDYAFRAAEAWRGGDYQADSGVLVVVSTADRKSRIEVGKGLGGALTDLQCFAILEAARTDLGAHRYAAGIDTILDGVFTSTAQASTADKDGGDAARWRAREASRIDHPGGRPMPWSILGAIFGGLITITLAMLRLPFWWKGAIVSLGVGAVLVPASLFTVPFWPAFYAPWILGVLLGSAVGAVAREEKLTALLLVASAAAAAVPPLLPYKAIAHWQPPWETTDVILISIVEVVALGIGTWVAAAALLVVLALLIGAPVNIIALVVPRRAGSSGWAAKDDVNGWFKDRFAIVFGILGVVGVVGAAGRHSRARRRGSDRPRSPDSSRDEDYKGGGGTFGGGGASDDY